MRRKKNKNRENEFNELIAFVWICECKQKCEKQKKNEERNVVVHVRT